MSIQLSIHLMVFDSAASGIISGAEMIKLRAATVSNISALGMRIHTNELSDSWASMLTNSTISLMLRFSLPGCPAPINATGKVMWVKIGQNDKYILGVTFTSIKESDQNCIAQFVAAESAKQ